MRRALISYHESQDYRAIERKISKLLALASKIPRQLKLLSTDHWSPLWTKLDPLTFLTFLLSIKSLTLSTSLHLPFNAYRSHTSEKTPPSFSGLTIFNTLSITFSAISNFLCTLQADKNEPHITTFASNGILLMVSYASPSRPVLPNRSTMHP
ncbi:aspartate--tRNA ligase [Striga asiatica]|uniref:Aspartate--tRNA ligase n=1 Tax=Striga asiatica TaxID=4170 RepID=A0A5A7QLK9_STRAF|nr:aspartate--tRNA ligase [Striga asiatica]